MARAAFVRPGRLPSSRSIDLHPRCKLESRAMKVRLFFGKDQLQVVTDWKFNR